MRGCRLLTHPKQAKPVTYYQLISTHYREQLILIYAFDVDLDLAFDLAFAFSF